MNILKELRENLISGNEDEVAKLTERAIKKGIDIEKILNEGLIPGMEIVGEKFQANEIFVPEMLISAKAMKAGMKILNPLLIETEVEPMGKVVIGTVKGDLHDIGKNLVAMMLEATGFEVTDAGNDVTPEKFIELTENTGANILGLSALLTTTMVEIKNTIEVFEEKGIRENIKIMIGGAPVNDNYSKECAADGYAPDAVSAVDLAKTLVRK